MVAKINQKTVTVVLNEERKRPGMMKDVNNIPIYEPV
jgi:hypothetical protein